MRPTPGLPPSSSSGRPGAADRPSARTRARAARPSPTGTLEAIPQELKEILATKPISEDEKKHLDNIIGTFQEFINALNKDVIDLHSEHQRADPADMPPADKKELADKLKAYNAIINNLINGGHLNTDQKAQLLTSQGLMQETADKHGIDLQQPGYTSRQSQLGGGTTGDGTSVPAGGGASVPAGGGASVPAGGARVPAGAPMPPIFPGGAGMPGGMMPSMMPQNNQQMTGQQASLMMQGMMQSIQMQQQLDVQAMSGLQQITQGLQQEGQQLQAQFNQTTQMLTKQGQDYMAGVNKEIESEQQKTATSST